jgi:hypothetical protein
MICADRGEVSFSDLRERFVCVHQAGFRMMFVSYRFKLNFNVNKLNRLLFHIFGRISREMERINDLLMQNIRCLP